MSRPSRAASATTSAQRGDVAQAEVQTLAGDRVHAVRRIADQREAVRHQRAGEMHVERPGSARARQRDGAQPIAEALLDLGQEAGIVERQDRARPVRRPPSR